MAHDVSFKIPERSLGRADIEFNVKNSSGKIGTLKISKGSIVWVPVNAQRGRRINWVDFAKLMEEHASSFEMN